MVQVANQHAAGDQTAPVLAGRIMAYLLLELVLFVFYLAMVYPLFGFPHLGSMLLAKTAVLPGFIAVIGLGLALGTLLQLWMLALIYVALARILIRAQAYRRGSKNPG